MKEIIKKYKEPVIETPINNGTGIGSIVGSFSDTSATPTVMPRTFGESIMLDNTTNKLHYYDKKNSLWRSTGSVFSGSMSSGGTFQLPTSWVGTVVSTGYIQIAHTLGTANFNVIIGPNDSEPTHYMLAGTTTTHFYLYTYIHDFATNTVVQSTRGFQFIVNVY